MFRGRALLRVLHLACIHPCRVGSCKVVSRALGQSEVVRAIGIGLPAGLEWSVSAGKEGLAT